MDQTSGAACHVNCTSFSGSTSASASADDNLHQLRSHNSVRRHGDRARHALDPTHFIVDVDDGHIGSDETDAADLVLREAKGFGHNAFKIELARRSIVRALSQAARGTPQSQSNKKIA